MSNNVGWVCPKCKNSVAPSEKMCPNCKQEKVDESTKDGKDVLLG